MDSAGLTGNNLFGEELALPKMSGPLGDKYGFPPFSVLDAKQGPWQARKRMWIQCGIRGELGRDLELMPTGANSAYGGNGFAGARGGVRNAHQDQPITTSVFDPVLCELMYRWFCPEGGQVVDPFAGGSVRGIVAAMLGFKYWGCDLSSAQIAANREQKQSICPDAPLEWVIGDSTAMLDNAPRADFIMSCPPYGDLEIYSDDPADLSNMDYRGFIAAYRKIVAKCAGLLSPGCMACFVVGDFRDKRTGYYRGFVADTVNAFRDAGLHLYNDAVLLTSIGSLPVRIGKQFEAGRKLGKAHQNVLIFKKGNK